MFIQFIVNGIASGCQLTIFALAFWLRYSSARFADVSPAAVFVLGGYSYLFLIERGVGSTVAVLGAVALGGMAGGAADVFIFRPLNRRSASAAVLLLTSLALHGATVNMLAIFFGNAPRMSPAIPSPGWMLGVAVLSRPQAFQIIVAAVVAMIWIWVFVRTAAGVHLRSAAEDPSLYMSFGFDFDRTRTISACAAGGLAALAACTAASAAGVSPSRGMPALLDALTAAFLGGAMTFVGPVFGAVALGLSKSIVSAGFSERWEPAVTYVALAIVLASPRARVRLFGGARGRI